MGRDHLRHFSVVVLGLLTTGGAGLAQTDSTYTAPAAAASTPEDKPALKSEELDALVAPIALYPDDLLSQVLMASTYPLEVVQADRWVKKNKELKGDALAKALEKEGWDPSVKSLINVPDVLTMMDDKIDWTMKLGDAFIEQQKDVMAAVQRLRGKAKDAGNLKDSKEQKIVVEQAPAPTVVTEAAPTQTIVIQSTNPEVIYVPQYNPTVVYGTWAYPAYPPYPVYPPGYVAGTAAISFGVGMAVGAAWGYAWGGCNWNGGDVNIDVDRNTNINNNIDRSKYKNNVNRSETNLKNGKGTWQHDASHREGVPYRDKATAQKYENRAGGTGLSSPKAEQARQDFRGRTDSGGLGASSANRGSSAGARPDYSSDLSRSRQASDAAANRSGGGTSGSRAPTNRSSAFEGADRSGSAARTSSQRGQASRSSSAARSGGGGAARSGGGASRGGGGGGRGGGGRR